MDEPTANPIAERLIHADHGPDARVARWIGWGIGGLVWAGILLERWVFGTSGMVIILPVLIALAEVLLITSGLVLAAILMARYRRADDFALLRLAGLTPGAIVDGYIQGISYRLRYLPELTVGLAVGVLAPLAILLVIAAVFTEQVILGLLIAGLALALEVGLLLALKPFLTLFIRDMIRAGVWLGLRHTRDAHVIAGAVALVLLACAVITLIVAPSGAVACCTLPPGWLAILLLVDGRARFFRADSIRAVEADLGEEDAA